MTDPLTDEDLTLRFRDTQADELRRYRGFKSESRFLMLNVGALVCTVICWLVGLLGPGGNWWLALCGATFSLGSWISATDLLEWYRAWQRSTAELSVLREALRRRNLTPPDPPETQ